MDRTCSRVCLYWQTLWLEFAADGPHPQWCHFLSAMGCWGLRRGRLWEDYVRQALPKGLWSKQAQSSISWSYIRTALHSYLPSLQAKQCCQWGSETGCRFLWLSCMYGSAYQLSIYDAKYMWYFGIIGRGQTTSDIHCIGILPICNGKEEDPFPNPVVLLWGRQNIRDFIQVQKCFPFIKWNGINYVVAYTSQWAHNSV